MCERSLRCKYLQLEGREVLHTQCHGAKCFMFFGLLLCVEFLWQHVHNTCSHNRIVKGLRPQVQLTPSRIPAAHFILMNNDF